MTSWTVSTGVKKAGPFSQQHVLQLAAAGKIPKNAFIRDEAETTDWCHLGVVDWLDDSTPKSSARYCPNCDSRVLVPPSLDAPIRCPECSGRVRFVDYLDETTHAVPGIPIEPWNKYDGVVFVATCIALTAGGSAAISLLWNPWLAVMLGFTFIVTGGALFGVTYTHRSQTSKYRKHLSRLESELSGRSTELFRLQSEHKALIRSLVKVREDLIRSTEEEFRPRRAEIAAMWEEARDSADAVHRMANRFLEDTRKWWTGKLNGENYPLTKERIQKAIGFCRKQGYEVSRQQETDLMAQLKVDYELVLRREREKSNQQRIREQMRAEQRAERDRKREVDRIEAERRAIEKALEEAMRTVGAGHSAEIEILREKLRQAEERGRRAQAQAELTRVGHVYVISNIGAFGDNVFKVGLTRRLEPRDRVKELGDASVPFSFDVHMMIGTEDAPKLESTLHNALNKYRVNRVNFRKEFFRVDLETIRREVEKHHGVVEYVADPEALEYRESQNISEEDFEYLQTVAVASGVEDEDDDLDGLDGE